MVAVGKVVLMGEEGSGEVKVKEVMVVGVVGVGLEVEKVVAVKETG